jgi:predicted SprT family Zn-dependent metalloprotease
MAFKVTPDVREAMDYIDLKTYASFDSLCSAGLINRNITEIPKVKFSRAINSKLGICSRTCRVNGFDLITNVESYITYNLIFIEQNVYEPEFWERIDNTIIHEVCHLTLEHIRGQEMLRIGGMWDKHGPVWIDAMQYLGIANPQQLADLDEYTERAKGFAFTCPTCRVTQAAWSKPPKGKSYICPICREKGTRTLIPKELVVRVK